MGIQVNNLCVIKDFASKDLFCVKSNSGGFHGGFVHEGNLYIDQVPHTSALRACNEVRAKRKQMGIKQKVLTKPKDTKASSEITVTAAPPTPKSDTAFRTKIRRSKNVYSEEEVAAKPYLRFREIWLILGPSQRSYVKRSLCSGLIAEYCTDKEKAEVFYSYESAKFRLNTLDLVLKKGHQLRRFYEPRDDYES